MVKMPCLRAISWAALVHMSIACSKTVSVDVRLVEPCNQQPLAALQWLEFEPRGTDIDSNSLANTVSADAKNTEPLTLPLVPDFQLVVTGYSDEAHDVVAAIGVSAPQDLGAAKDAVTIPVPIALTDAFYRTSDLATPTDLSEPRECTELVQARYGGTASWIASAGRAVVVGGFELRGEAGMPSFEVLSTAIESYDPATGTFEVVGELDALEVAAFHTATPLADGRLLVAGGQSKVGSGVGEVKRALVLDAHDPKRVEKEAAFAMKVERAGHAAVRMEDGRVVVLGGRRTIPRDGSGFVTMTLDSIEIFDPATGVFVADLQGDSLKMSAPRFGHTATLLQTGRHILVAGGMNEQGPVRTLEAIRIDGNSATVTSVQNLLAIGPIHHAAARADSGDVLLSGGYSSLDDGSKLPTDPSRNAEMWSFLESTGKLQNEARCTASMSAPRAFHAVAMFGRRAVFLGGRDETDAPRRDAEIVTLASGANCFATQPAVLEMAEARAQFMSAVLESTGELLIVGGRQRNEGQVSERSIRGTEVFSPFREP